MSEHLYRVEASVKTPEIVVMRDRMTMTGRSLPEDAIDFYQPAIAALKQAAINSGTYTLLFYIEYLNTSSSSIIRSIMEMFHELSKSNGVDYNIVWHFEEDDLEMEELGKHYEQTIPGLNIEYLEVDGI